MRSTSTELAEATIVRRATTALAARARAEREGRLSLNQLAVLGRVAAHGPITPGEVAAALGMLPQSLTRTFAALEDAGLLRRTPDPADGRQALLGVTGEGRTALRAEMAPRDRWIARAMAATLTPDERRTVLEAATLLERLVEFGGAIAVVER
jgi:DNA-binding MarR family transcriptional regulator